MKMVSANNLKAKMLDFLREVEATGEALGVTDNDQMVLKIISYRRETGDETLVKEPGKNR